MRSVVSICNQALSYAGLSQEIASLDDATVESRQCKTFYESSRDELLSAHPWRWATSLMALALLGETSPAWRFVYAWPLGGLRVQALHLPGARTEEGVSERFVTGRGLQGRVVFSDAPDALAQVTMQVTDPVEFPSYWADTLAWLLALKIAPTLAGNKTSLREHLTEYYLQAFSHAKILDANEACVVDRIDDRYIRARS